MVLSNTEVVNGTVKHLFVFTDGAKQSAIFGQSLGQCAIDRISLILDFLAQPESKPL